MAALGASAGDVAGEIVSTGQALSEATSCSSHSSVAFRQISRECTGENPHCQRRRGDSPIDGTNQKGDSKGDEHDNSSATNSRKTDIEATIIHAFTLTNERFFARFPSRKE